MISYDSGQPQKCCPVKTVFIFLKQVWIPQFGLSQNAPEHGVNHIFLILTPSCTSEMCAWLIPPFLFPSPSPSQHSSYSQPFSSAVCYNCLPSPLSSLLSSCDVSFCEYRDKWKRCIQRCLFQILPPQPLTSCLSFTSCPLCPSVSFVISNFIYLPMLCFIPCSLFLLVMSSTVCLLTSLPSSPILLQFLVTSFFATVMPLLALTSE